MILKKDSKRAAIYVIYDKDGIIDDYIIYQLNDLVKNLNFLLIVVNGKLSIEGRKRLSGITQDIFVRENEGYDAWAYKAGIEYIGWEALRRYDELVLMNDSCFGPLYPFAEIFDKMNGRDSDFWGITKHPKTDFDPFGLIECGYIPEHIQTYFMVIRGSMLQNYNFKCFWEQLPVIESFHEAVCYYEVVFTKTFEDMGFISDVYIDTAAWNNYAYNMLLTIPLELMRDKRCPLFKKKSFLCSYENIFTYTNGDSTLKLYKHISSFYEYDMDMVWQHILRTGNLADIKANLHLNYIAPSGYLLDDTASQKPLPKNDQYKIALVYHIYYTDMLGEIIGYFNNMPDGADIYITTDSEEKKQAINNSLEKTSLPYQIILVQNQGRDVSALLIGVRDYIFKYDLVCFAHTKRSFHTKPYSIGSSFSRRCIENVFGSKLFVANIIALFEQNPRLGILAPPPPNHSNYKNLLGYLWTNNFDNVENLLEELQIHVDIDPDKQPVAPFGSMFWFRPAAIKPLYNKTWRYEDFPAEPLDADGTLSHAIERSHGFAAQSAGYYTGYVLNDTFAKIEMTNLEFIAAEFKQKYTSLDEEYSALIEKIHQDYRKSFSWKITKPLRFFKRMVKKLTPKPLWSCLRRLRHSVRS